MILQKIQSALVAPKSQTNSFGNYKYRSCEDILQALKPHLESNDCALIIKDDIVVVGERVYVKATASLVSDKSVLAETTAFAREPLSKKGADEAQVTGATSSYARKYALNGLFAIDDTKDADTDEMAKQSKNAPVVEAKQPRVPHDQQLSNQMGAMDSAANLEMLKILSGSAYDYWSAWNLEDNSKKIRSHYEKLAKTFEQPLQEAS